MALEKFLELGSLIKKDEDKKIIITGKKDEIEIFNKYLARFGLVPEEILSEELSLRQLVTLISKSDMLITNSTGPLHCAAALGIHTISFYSPVRVCTPVRWGPFTEEHEKHYVFMPGVDQCEKCIKEKCKHFNCMDLIKADEVYNKVNEMIKE
ncbi:glycosyltransferase family 9 protein [bacterium]